MLPTGGSGVMHPNRNSTSSVRLFPALRNLSASADMQLSKDGQPGWSTKACSVVTEEYEENVIFQRFIEVTEEMVSSCLRVGYNPKSRSS